MSIKLRGYKLNIKNWVLTIASVFAFVLSPFYGVVADYVASAAGAHVVTAVDSQGWKFVTTGNATGSYSTQPSTQLLGDGSYELKSTSGQKGYLYDTSFNNRLLNSFSTLEYSYFVANRNAGTSVAPSLSLITTINGTWTELKVEPTYTNGAPAGSWQTIDAFAPTTKWYSTHDLYTDNTHTTVAVHGGDAVANMVPWSTLVALDSNAKLGSDDGASGVRLTFGQNSGGSPWSNFLAYVDKVEINSNTYNFEPITIQPCSTTNTVNTTDLSTWDRTETRTTGHNALVSNGLHVWTEGTTSTDKAAGYYPASFDLSDLGEGFGVTTSSGSGTLPSLQLLVDLDNDGVTDGYLVGEPVSYGVNTLWLSGNWNGIDLSNAPTTINGGGTGKGGDINAWLAAFPNAKVSAIGYSLGSGALGNYVVSQIAAGCTDYTFTALPPNAPQNLVFSLSNTNTTLGQMHDGDGTNTKPANSGLGYIWGHWDNDPAVDYQITTYFKKADGTWKQLHNSSPIKPTPYRFYGFGDEGEGVYRFRVAAYNPTTGLTSAYTNATLIYDHSSPSAHFTTAPTDGAAINGNFTVAGEASDNVKLKSVFFDVRDSSGWVAGCVSGTMAENYSSDHKTASPTCTINTAGLLDGHTYTLRIHAGDYSNYGGGESRTITIDRTLPVIQIDGNAPKLTYKLTDGLSVHVIDSNLSNTEVDRTDAQAPSNDKHWNYTGAWFGLSWLKDGQYTLTAHDKAGNSTTASFTTDRTKPHVDGVVTGATTISGTNYNPTNIEITATDDIKSGWFNSGIKTVTGNIYKYDDIQSKYVLSDGNSSTTNPFTVDLSTLTDGKYYVKYNAADNVGNTSNTETYYFVVDHTAPTLLRVEISNVHQLDNTHYLTSAVMNASGLLEVQVTMDEPRGVGTEVQLTSINRSGNTTHYSQSSTPWVHLYTQVPNSAPGEYTYKGYIDLNQFKANDGTIYDLAGDLINDATVRVRLTDPVQNVNGTYYAVDASGQTIQTDIDNSGDSRNYKLTIDNIAPVVSVTPLASDGILHDTETFSITVADDFVKPTDSVWVYLYNNNSPYKQHGAHVTLTNGHGTFTVDTTLLDDGATSLDVQRLYDLAGNPSGTGDSYFHGYTIDNSGPSVPVLDPALNEAYFNTTPIKDTWTASTDDISGVAGYQVAYSYDDNHSFGNDTDWTTTTIPGHTQLTRYTTNLLNQLFRNHNPSSSEQGGVTVWVRAVDNLGNVSAWSTPVHYYYDTIAPDAPVLSVTGLTSGDVTNQYSLPATWTKPSSDTVKYEYQYWNDITGNQWKESHPYSVITTHQGRTGSFTEGEGVHHMRVRAIDAAGNVSAWSNVFDVTYDNTAPTISLTAPTTVVSAVGDSPVAIVYSVNDSNLDTYQLTINGAEVQGGTVNADGTYDWDLTVTGLTSGDYTITLTATDKAGNTTSDTKTVTVDNTAPDNFSAVINLLSGVSTSRTFSGTSEPGSTVTVEVHSTVVSDSTTADVDGNWSLTFDNLEVGSHTAYVTAADDFGNTTTSIDIPFTVTEAGRGGTRTLAVAANTSSAPVVLPAAPVATTDGSSVPSVLGAQDTKSDDGSAVKGASDTKKDNNTCYKIFGICWYWWILILIVVGLIIWWIVAKKRKNDK